MSETPAEHASAHLEEIFRCGVGVVDAEPLADNEERMGQSAEQRVGLDRRGLRMPARIRLFGRAAQAVYPCCRPYCQTMGCTIFKQARPYDLLIGHHMKDFSWEQHQFCRSATFLFFKV